MISRTSRLFSRHTASRMSSTWALHYTYVPEIMEKRDPYRPAHLDLAKALIADGKMVVAGPYADASGALFIFQGEGMSREFIEAEFVKKDSYGKADLVSSYDIKEWNAALGSLGGGGGSKL